MTQLSEVLKIFLSFKRFNPTSQLLVEMSCFLKLGPGNTLPLVSVWVQSAQQG